MFRPSPIGIIAAWVFFIFSFAFPPLLLISVPVLAMTIIGIAREAKRINASRDYYIEEHNLIQGSKLFRSGR